MMIVSMLRQPVKQLNIWKSMFINWLKIKRKLWLNRRRIQNRRRRIKKRKRKRRLLRLLLRNLHRNSSGKKLITTENNMLKKLRKILWMKLLIMPNVSHQSNTQIKEIFQRINFSDRHLKNQLMSSFISKSHF